MSDHLVNAHLGQYHLIEIIGRGGMATVYKAHQTSLDRFVAVKVLTRTLDPEFSLRFKREAYTIARLHHPNILAVYDYADQDGLLYLVMPCIDQGLTLQDLLDRPMEPAWALRLMARVLDALDYAHQRGVIHRDVKPSNILITSSNWPVLADFGIAKLMDESLHFTQSGMIIGTAAYLAPEQATGQPIDGRTDLYACGIILYESLTGRVPFDATTPLGVMHQHVYDPPLPPRRIKPDLPESVEAVLLRALAKDPHDRYQTASELAAALERIAGQLERPRTLSPRKHRYEAGARVDAAGHWEAAVEQGSQLVAIEPEDEDATEMSQDARDVQAHALMLDQSQPDAAVPTIAAPVNDPPSMSVTPSPIQSKLTLGLTRSNAAPGLPAAAAEQPGLARRWMRIVLGTAVSLLALTIILVASARTLPETSTTELTRAVGAMPSITLATTLPPDTKVSTSMPATADTRRETPTPPRSISPQPSLMPPNAVVTSMMPLRLRNGPGQQFASLGAYERSAAVEVTGRNPAGTWLRVRTPDGRTGWMSKEYLQINISLDALPVENPPTPAPMMPISTP
jgi:serine/threonine protein kinase